jgi:hypothetical protein
MTRSHPDAADPKHSPPPLATWAAPQATWPLPPPEAGDTDDDGRPAGEPAPADPFNEDGHPQAELMRDLVGPDANPPACDSDVDLGAVDGPDADVEPGDEDPDRRAPAVR